MINYYQPVLLKKTFAATAALACILISSAFAQQPGQKGHFGIAADPAIKKAHITLDLSGKLPDTVVFKMSVWTTGYYQFMNFGKSVSDFTATDESGKALDL